MLLTALSWPKSVMRNKPMESVEDPDPLLDVITNVIKPDHESIKLYLSQRDAIHTVQELTCYHSPPQAFTGGRLVFQHEIERLKRAKEPAFIFI